LIPITRPRASSSGPPDCRHGFAHLDAAGPPERERREGQPAGLELEQRNVGVGVVADDLGGYSVAVGELDEDVLRSLAVVGPDARGDDVSVGGHVAPAVEHEARALTTPSALRVKQAALEYRDHRYDPRGEALVDPPRVKAALAADALDDPDPRGGHLVRSATASLVA
jgi:hypothetical protein